MIGGDAYGNPSHGPEFSMGWGANVGRWSGRKFSPPNYPRGLRPYQCAALEYSLATSRRMWWWPGAGKGMLPVVLRIRGCGND